MSVRTAFSIRVLRQLATKQTPIKPSYSFTRPQISNRFTQSQRPAIVHVRHHSAPSNAPRVLNYTQIKQLSESPSPERVIIDVREPSEYSEGYIPGAINIPVKTQPDAIFLPEDEFEDRFGFSKPTKEQELVFYCKAGVRSSAAAQLAQQQGYPKIADYRGSWLDWQKNSGTVEKP